MCSDRPVGINDYYCFIYLERRCKDGNFFDMMVKISSKKVLFVLFLCFFAKKKANLHNNLLFLHGIKQKNYEQ